MAAEASTRALPWIATFLAIFIASPIAIGTKSEKPSAPVSASVEPASTAPTSPVSAYCAERLSVTLSEALLDATLAQAAPGDLSPVVATFAGEKKSIDVFIATIPDPIDSGYGYMFQSLLHSIQLGVEEELNGLQYFRTFAWLPWYDTKEATVKESEACREQTPGFVAFRSSKEGHYGLVLLVGETPTRGLVPLAMQQALAIVKAFRQQQTTPVLKILGPVFSGSAASLKQAVSTLDASWDVTIVSGTATGTGLRQQLSRTRPVGGAHGKIEFWTTTVPEAVMQCRYLAFLCHYINTEGRSNGKRVCTGERTGRGRHPGAVESVELPQVALLHESGTQFGTSVVGGAGGPCRYEAGFNAEFPANVSTLRDAYESHDKDSGAKKNGTRVTSLEVSLREPRPPPGLASQPSPKGTFARDLALSRTIAALESQHVTHVGVQATEVADAIFISRKIRDVAPDIRVAVFQADSLLLHPDFRSLLQGALVITPYPFLGTSDFAFTSSAPGAIRAYRNFENSNAQGVFNAVLALRSAPAQRLFEYDLGHPEGEQYKAEPRYSTLPVWITAVGTNRFVPIAVVPNSFGTVAADLRDNPVYPGLIPTDRASPVLTAGRNGPRDSWKTPFKVLHAPRERPPRASNVPSLSWSALLLLVGLLSAVDVALQIAKWKTFAPRKTFRVPRQVTSQDERLVDLVAIRLRWQLYAAVRAGLQVLTILYLCVFSWLKCSPFASPELTIYYVISGMFLSVPAAWWCYNMWGFGEDLCDFWRARSITRSPVQSRILLALKSIGILKPDDGLTIVRVSQYQSSVLLVILAFAGLFLTVTHIQAFWNISEAVTGVRSELAKALTIERMLTLVGGVSPATPTLLLLGIVYFWTVGRMASLQLSHSVSRMTPPDGVPDFISTPIRLILYPRTDTDSAFTQVERNSVNSVIRPTTGPKYLCSFAALMVLPWALFMPSPISTLERGMHSPLVALFYIAYGLIVSSLLQLFQYWFSLELLLKGVYQHAVGRAFSRAAPFVRESLDEQISNTPSDLLRLAACVGEFEKLQRWACKPTNTIAKPHQEELSRAVARLRELRELALEALGPRNTSERSRREGELGLDVISATKMLVQIVDKEREIQARADEQREVREYSKDDARWINDVEDFVATVVTILINRHVRQLRNIVYPLLVSVLLFIAAILGYPFEPRRLLTSSAWALILVSVFASVWTYLQLDRNALLSNIASSNPGQITANADLVFRLLKWGLLPILAAVAADYPDLVQDILKWARPVPIWQ